MVLYPPMPTSDRGCYGIPTDTGGYWGPSTYAEAIRTLANCQGQSWYASPFEALPVLRPAAGTLHPWAAAELTAVGIPAFIPERAR